MKANLIPLKMWDFNVILGMDWLFTHQSSVDCFTKNVIFQNPRFSKLEFEGDHKVLSTCVISAFEAKRLLHKGCEAYLAHMIDTSTPEVTLENVLVMQELSDIFFEDLLRLLSNRGLDFYIDLLPKIAPFLYH